MKRKRKNFLGCIGLVLVAAMTVVAYSIPSPDANAETADGVTVMVTVNNGQEPAVHINTPYDSSRTVHNNVDLKISYSNATNISGTVTNTETGDSVSFENATPDPESNIYTVDNLDFSAAGSYDKYSVSVSATNLNGFAEDAISFFYLPVITDITGHAENNDPILTLGDKSDEVGYITIQAYKQPENTPLFNPVLQYKADEVLGKDITLPFADNNAGDSAYNIEVISYTSDEEGNIGEQINGPIETPTEYVPPEVPEVPDTGAFFTNLNITETDYLITGLIVFFIIGISLIIFMKKSSRR